MCGHDPNASPMHDPNPNSDPKLTLAIALAFRVQTEELQEQMGSGVVFEVGRHVPTGARLRARVRPRARARAGAQVPGWV